MSQNDYTQIRLDQAVELADVLAGAYTTEAEFNRLVQRLNMSLVREIGDIAGLDLKVLHIVNRFNGDYQLIELVDMARRYRPNNPQLLKWQQLLSPNRFEIEQQTKGKKTKLESNDALEAQIRRTYGFEDPYLFYRRLTVALNAVCQITVTFGTEQKRGTGFLIDPDLVLTNYHVIYHNLYGYPAPDDIQIRFDHALYIGGSRPQSGKPYELPLKDWLVDESPYSEADISIAPAADPSPEELDYIVLRVQGSPGTEQFENGEKRDWLKLPTRPTNFSKDMPLFILQHPELKVDESVLMKLALDDQAVIGENRNGTRVHYYTETGGGASGSPCFDSRWNLVALHHSTDPIIKIARPKYNQGIPAYLIRKLLEARGKLT
jgi:hypothetical protein